MKAISISTEALTELRNIIKKKKATFASYYKIYLYSLILFARILQNEYVSLFAKSFGNLSVN